MNQERLLKVLVTPHISEKSTLRAETDNQIVFKVATDATKQEVKAAVEMLFEVKVEGVNILNQQGKSKRFGRLMGRRNGTRKAYVKLAPGQDIDFIGGE